jgi:hypothetical protein
MTAVNIKAFRGQIPRVSERLQTPNHAARALNCKLTSGSIDPLAGIEQVYTTNRNIKTAYRYRAFIAGSFADNWLTWEEDINVVPSPNANDPDGRFYFSSESYEPRMSSYNLAISTVPYPTAWYSLGVAAPTVAATLSVTLQPVGSIDIDTGGEAYESAPTVTFSSGAAAGTAVISGEVLSIDVTNGGSGYTSVPAVVIKGKGGVGARAKAVVESGVVKSVEIEFAGVGFTEAPTITFVDGGGTSAAATAKISAKVVRVDITASGSYTTLPTVTFSGGNATTQATGTVVFKNYESRFYTYTFVTAFGEESPPAPPSALTEGSADGTWAISGLQTAPINSGTITAASTTGANVVRVTLNSVFGIAQYDTLTFAGISGMTSLNGSFRVQSVDPATNRITVSLSTAQTYTSGGTWTRNAPFNTTGMVKRIYRTVGTSGLFLLIAEIPVATTTYSDTVTADDLGEELPTADSLLPPKNLTSLISLPNGCLAGIAGNELCFSDPYMPYSWPLRNRYAFSGVGVAAIAASNSVIVLTETFPILYTGSDPEAMSGSTLETYAPCVSKRGVVDIGSGALYPSFDGLWLVSTQQVQCITRKLYREEEWTLLNPATFDAVFHDGQYYAYYEGQNESRILLIDLESPDSVVEVDESADAMYRNELDGKLYISKGTNLYEWDVDTGHYYESDWQSVDMQFPAPLKFAAAQIHADYSAIVPIDTTQITANEALIALGADAVAGHLDGAELLSFEINGSYIVPVELDTQRKVQFTLFSGDTPVYTRNVSSAKFFRLPANISSEVYSVGLSASVKVYNVTVAESVEELSRTSA